MRGVLGVFIVPTEALKASVAFIVIAFAFSLNQVVAQLEQHVEHALVAVEADGCFDLTTTCPTRDFLPAIG